MYMYMYICLCIYMNKPDYIGMFLLEWNNLNENMNVNCKIIKLLKLSCLILCCFQNMKFIES